MGRFLAIDYGSKRIGIAVTDPLKMFVNPLLTIENKNDEFVFQELLKIFNEQDIERIVIGLPLNFHNEDTEKTKEVRAFYDKLEKMTELPMVFFNESYSTCDANDFLKSKKLGWKESKKMVDQIAAAVILTGYVRG